MFRGEPELAGCVCYVGCGEVFDVHLGFEDWGGEVEKVAWVGGAGAADDVGWGGEGVPGCG